MDPAESESDDSDNEDKVERRDSAAMLDSWLAELDSLTVEIDLRQAGPLRFSSATLEDTQEDELNAILGELSALQMNLDREIKPHDSNQYPTSESKSEIKHQISCDNGSRTESPDNDSGFSDNASLLSSGSSLSASGSSSGSSTTSSHQKSPLSPVPPANDNEKRAKIREALEKMRAASVTRLYVKAFSADGSSKALMIEESMSCGKVLGLFADKNHVPFTSKWALVEHLPHLQMERIYEDHENMVENLLMWTRDSKNKIYFVVKEEKYDIFNNPLRYLGNRFKGNPISESAGRNSGIDVIEEFFGQGVSVPEVESQLYLKAEGKKAWKKFPFVLRASGLYYYPKGKVSSNPSKDLVCLSSIDNNMEAYQGIGWKKKFKAPTEFGFALKPSRLQVKAPRHIKYLCAEDGETLAHWMVGLRLAKHGKQLWDNFKCLQSELVLENIEFEKSTLEDMKPIQISSQLIRAENLVNMSSGRDSTSDTVSLRDLMPTRKISCTDVYSGIITSLPPSQSGREEGFAEEAPVGGTIKRKPSTVKIPLTFNTRSLVSEYITNAEVPPISLSHTLQRKRSGSGSSTSTSSVSSHNFCQSPIMLKPATNPCVVDDSFDPLEYESLPPPPPELLVGDNESYCQNQSQSYVSATPPSYSNENDVYPSFVPRISDNDLPLAVAYRENSTKNVSFSSELQSRLNSRKPIGSDNLAFPKNTQNYKNKPVMRNTEEPTPDFLNDLKRVMEKKWQIAQKCRSEGKETAHEILGFRVEPGPSDRISQSEDDTTPNSLNNVRAWVSQHYGNSLDGCTQVTTPTFPPPPPVTTEQQPQYSIPIISKPSWNSAHITIPQISSQNVNMAMDYNHMYSPSQRQSSVIYENIQDKNTSNHFPIQNVQVRNKKPPPPIPKRADSTHLSAHFVYN